MPYVKAGRTEKIAKASQIILIKYLLYVYTLGIKKYQSNSINSEIQVSKCSIFDIILIFCNPEILS